MPDPALEPLKPPDAKKLAREIMDGGEVESEKRLRVVTAWRFK